MELPPFLYVNLEAKIGFLVCSKSHQMISNIVHNIKNDTNYTSLSPSILYLLFSVSNHTKFAYPEQKGVLFLLFQAGKQPALPQVQ